MTKFFVLWIFILMSSLPTHGQSFWGNTTLSGATNEAIDIESDNLGNSYVAGYFSGGTSFQLGAAQVNSQGNSDVYVAKYSPLGALIWIKTFGGSFSDKPTDLALDNLGNILVTGEFFGLANFGSTVLNSINSSKDIFILKLDNSGIVQWAISEGAVGSENAFGITVDGLNNVIVTGQFQGTSNIGGQTLTSMIDPTTNAPNYDLFISKYSPTGTNLWIKTGVAKYAERGLAVSVDATNNIFVTGQFSDTLNLAGTIINNIDYNVGLIAKLNSLGTLQWLNTLKAGTVVPYDIKLNSSNEPVIIGDFTGTMQYGTGSANTAITAANSNKIFALKIANSGAHLWNNTFSSNSALSARALSIDIAKNVFITGYFECGWTEFQSGPLPSTFNSAGFKDPYLISINNTGTTLFVKTFGGAKNDQGHGIAFDDLQNPVICGSFTADLNIPTLGTTYQTSPSPFDFNLAGGGLNQSYVLLEGDLTRNSFLTNAVHGTTPDYNYFNGMAIDSLYGQIYGGQDTIHYCFGETINYIPKTIDDYGPNYNYLWSTGSTTEITYLTQTGVYTVQVQREDGCVTGYDTIVGILDPMPTLPFMNDNIGVAVNTINYPTYQFCAPDSVSIWFNNLCDGCTMTVSPGGISDTLPHNYTLGAEYTVTIQLGPCSITNNFWVVLDSVVAFDSIQPYLYFVEDTDQNDTISICHGDTLSVHAYDSLSNPPSPILFEFHEEPFNYYVFSSTNTFLYLPGVNNNMFINQYRPDTSGWYVFEYFASIGYDNICGVDTIHYIITDSIYIDMAPIVSSNLQITAADTLCPSSSTFLTASISYSNFVWSGPGIVYINPGNDSAQVAVSGLYHYAGILTDSISGCSANIDVTFELEEIQPPDITTNPLDGVICPGDSVVLTVPNDYVSYNWIDPNGNSPSNTNILVANTVGFYYCNIVDSNGCSLTSTPSELFQYNTPGASASPQNIICDNTSITISVAAVGTPAITWLNPISGGSASQITVTQPGTYICQIDQCGLTTIDSVTIQDGSFSINISATDTFLCYQDTSVISVDSGYSYVWNISNDTTNSIQAFVAGNYSVIATNQFGCEVYSDTLTILNAPFAYPPDVDDTTICYGDSVTLVDNGFTVVYWYDQDTNFLASVPSYNTPPLFQSQIIYAKYNSNVCPATYDSINITVIQPLASNSIIGDTILCAGDSTVLHLSNNQGAVNWFLNNLFAISDTSITVQANTGMSLQQIKILSSNICFNDSLLLNVYTIPSPVLNVNPDTVTLCGADVQSVNVTTNLDSIIWTTPFGLEYGTSIDVSSIYPHGSTIQIQGYDTNLCASNAASVYVQVTDTIDLSILSSPTICLSDFVTLTANANANNFQWSGPFGNVNASTITFQLATNDGVYTIQVTDSLGCQWSNSINVSAVENTFPPLPDTICCFTTWLKDFSVDSVYYYSDGSGFSFDTLSMSDNTSYQITTTDSLGCEHTQSVFIVTVSCNTQIPNVITTNADGVNDYFLIDFSCNQDKDNLKIFNRWGNLVFEKQGYLNDWDGDNLSDGVYFYVYTWDTTTSPVKVSQGFVTITR